MKQKLLLVVGSSLCTLGFIGLGKKIYNKGRLDGVEEFKTNLECYKLGLETGDKFKEGKES